VSVKFAAQHKLSRTLETLVVRAFFSFVELPPGRGRYCANIKELLRALQISVNSGKRFSFWAYKKQADGCPSNSFSIGEERHK
jgi:hypothetical protein